MWKQYIKQALYQLKENRLISIVCMVGTALAILGESDIDTVCGSTGTDIELFSYFPVKLILFW